MYLKREGFSYFLNRRWNKDVEWAVQRILCIVKAMQFQNAWTAAL